MIRFPLLLGQQGGRTYMMTTIIQVTTHNTLSLTCEVLMRMMNLFDLLSLYDDYVYLTQVVGKYQLILTWMNRKYVHKYSHNAG